MYKMFILTEKKYIFRENFILRYLFQFQIYLLFSSNPYKYFAPPPHVTRTKLGLRSLIHNLGDPRSDVTCHPATRVF